MSVVTFTSHRHSHLFFCTWNITTMIAKKRKRISPKKCWRKVFLLVFYYFSLRPNNIQRRYVFFFLPAKLVYLNYKTKKSSGRICKLKQRPKYLNCSYNSRLVSWNCNPLPLFFSLLLMTNSNVVQPRREHQTNFKLIYPLHNSFLSQTLSFLFGV